jgi:hypothetical protein
MASRSDQRVRHKQRRLRWRVSVNAGREADGANLRDRIALERLRKSKDKDDRAAARNARKKPRDAWSRLRSKSDWDNEQLVRAGFWMMMQCATVLNCFEIKRGIPQIRTDCWIEADALSEELMWRDQVHAPHDKPPPDWTDPLLQYDDRLQVRFVKDWRPETQEAIAKAFRLHREFVESGDVSSSYEGGNNRRLENTEIGDSRGCERGRDFEHARGVNALRRVQFTIDPVLLDT